MQKVKVSIKPTSQEQNHTNIAFFFLYFWNKLQRLNQMQTSPIEQGFYELLHVIFTLGLFTLLLPSHFPKTQWPDQLILVSFQITPLLRCPQGPQGCLENWNCPPSLNLAQNSETLKNHQKTIIFCCFSCHFLRPLF